MDRASFAATPRSPSHSQLSHREHLPPPLPLPLLLLQKSRKEFR
jgi:hypothetical protein